MYYRSGTHIQQQTLCIHSPSGSTSESSRLLMLNNPTGQAKNSLYPHGTSARLHYPPFQGRVFDLLNVKCNADLVKHFTMVEYD